MFAKNQSKKIEQIFGKDRGQNMPENRPGQYPNSRVQGPGQYQYPPQQNRPIPEPKKKRKRSWVKIIFALIFLAALGFGGYYYWQYRKFLKDPNGAVKKESQSIINQLQKFMELPNEEPTLATVTDKEKLKQQVFFANAQNGDKILIFPKAAKAVLYRPSTKKVIEMMSISAVPQSPSQAPPQTTPQSVPQAAPSP